MYWLLGIDTVLRIAAAMALLFIAIPAMAWPRPSSFSRLDWLWFNLGVGITLLTLAGQLLTLFNIAGTLAYVVLLAAIVVMCRARRAELPVRRWIVNAYRQVIVFALTVLDQRADVRRRFVDGSRRMFAEFRATISEHRAAIAAWTTVVIAAAAVRFYRPFATANLGFSDTYVHLYLMRLLDQGRQVDPAWGPYPRGMHFLLLPIERLTNVDAILLLNFFGAFAGVLMTMSVAYAARRITQRDSAALIAGLIFATMIGGAHQYFAFGGSVSGDDARTARTLLSRPYEELADAGEFDVLLTAFQRQTSTLPQELAIVLLFPAALFLLDWFRTRDAWRLAGFVACTAAIAAVHSGVILPLVLLCAAASIAIFSEGGLPARPLVRGGGDDRSGRAGSPPSLIARAALAGFAGVALGSTWMLGFIRYRSVGAETHVGSTALYYFPFLRPFAGGNVGGDRAFMMLTPFLIVALIIAVVLAIAAIRYRDSAAMWLALATVIFTCTHAASVLGIPELIEVRRNVTWLAMTIAALLGVATSLIAQSLPQRIARAVPAVVAIAWLATLPNLFGVTMRSRLLDYSGYGTTTFAVVKMSHQLEPYTWTLVSYGQEYPMVLGSGFHLNGADFLDRFDPAEAPLRIPTPHVFIAVEKKPHRFQINNWSTRFDRAAVEERLQTWCMLYRLTHRDMRVWLDDENVRIYEISRREGRS